MTKTNLCKINPITMKKYSGNFRENTAHNNPTDRQNTRRPAYRGNTFRGKSRRENRNFLVPQQYNGSFIPNRNYINTGCELSRSWCHRKWEYYVKQNRKDDDDKQGHVSKEFKANQGCFICNEPHLKKYCNKIVQENTAVCSSYSHAS